MSLFYSHLWDFVDSSPAGAPGRRIPADLRDLAPELDSLPLVRCTVARPGEGGSDGSEIQESVNGIYRVWKNNEIMGQILRNKYGSITKQKIEEIIDIVADGGLRLVNFVLKDKDEISDMAHYVKAKNPDYDIQKIKRDLGWFSFVWTIINVENIVKSINFPEVSASIHNVAERTGTPAYDMIDYFTLLDAAPKLTDKEKTKLAKLLAKHPDPFVKRVLSIRTQHYMNTHRSRASMEQAICSLLGIKYLYRSVQVGG